MEKPRCPKCKGYLKLDYSFFQGQTKEMINCINCGWYGFVPASNQEAKQEELLADPAAVVAPTSPAPPAPIVKKETTIMSKRGDCPTCGRKDVGMPSSDKCSRCYDRIKKGLDPKTGQPVRKEPSTGTAGEQGPTRSLQEEVVWQMIKLGYKGVAISRAFKLANVPETASVDEAIELVAGQLGRDAANEIPSPRTPQAKGMVERDHRAAIVGVDLAKPGADTTVKGISYLLNHPHAHTVVLQLPDDIYQSLKDHEITPPDIVGLLHDLVNLRLVKVAA